MEPTLLQNGSLEASGRLSCSRRFPEAPGGSRRHSEASGKLPESPVKRPEGPRRPPRGESGEIHLKSVNKIGPCRRMAASRRASGGSRGTPRLSIYVFWHRTGI